MVFGHVTLIKFNQISLINEISFEKVICKTRGRTLYFHEEGEGEGGEFSTKLKNLAVFFFKIEFIKFYLKPILPKFSAPPKLPFVMSFWKVLGAFGNIIGLIDQNWMP